MPGGDPRYTVGTMTTRAGSSRRRAGALRASGAALMAVASLAVLAALGGCAVLPYGTSLNEPADGAPARTRASDEIGLDELDRGVFVGIALSGGGSRAANFSAAVLLELERLGWLRRASALSSVSGSSLTAAYFGLYHRPGAVDSAHWNERELRRRLAGDLQGELVARWMLPHNLVRYWFTNFDRSGVMRHVFERRLFDGRPRTFGEIGTGLPRILINATTIGGRPFVFSDQALAGLGSDLARLPLAEAVMASAAFPGAFPNVTLTDHANAGRFVHLFDGGASDNLGVETLERIVAALAAAPPPPGAAQRLRGCLFIVVDSNVDVAAQRDAAQSRQPHTRTLLSCAIDTNAVDALHALMAHRRDDTLRAIGQPRDRAPGTAPVWQVAPLPDALDAQGRPLVCHVWHIGFERLAQLGPAGRALAPVVDAIDTAFALRGPPQPTDDDPLPLPQEQARRLQHRLYEAAWLLVRTDDQALRKVGALFADWFPDNR